MGALQAGITERIVGLTMPGEPLVAGTYADHRTSTGEQLAAVVAGGAGVGALRRITGGGADQTDAPRYGYAGAIPAGVLALVVTDRRLLVLWCERKGAPLHPVIALAPHEYVTVSCVTGVLGQSLTVTFVDRTGVVLDLVRGHKGKPTAKAATELRRQWGVPNPW